MYRGVGEGAKGLHYPDPMVPTNAIQLKIAYLVVLAQLLYSCSLSLIRLQKLLRTHNKLIQGVVSGLAGCKQEAGFEDADGRADGHRVKVLDLDLSDGVSLVRQRDLVNISVLALDGSLCVM